MPDAGVEPGAVINARDPVGPGVNRGTPAQHRHYHPLVHAVPAFQPVDRRQVVLRIDEGYQLALDQTSVSGWSAEARCTDLLLPAGVDQWIGGAPGQDQALRHLERREPGMEVVEPAPDHSRFDAEGQGAEALMVPEALFQGAVDEEPEDCLGTVFRVCADSGRPWLSPCGRTFSASKSAVLRIWQLRGFSNVHAFTPSGSVPLRSWGMKRNSLLLMARASS